MNKIFSDKSVVAMKKIPRPVWWLIYAVSAVLADFYTYFTMPSVLNELFSDLAEAGISLSRFLWLAYPLSAAFSVFMFELIAYIAYVIFVRCSMTKLGRDDFVLRLRVIFIALNVILAVINSTYFYASITVTLYLVSIIPVLAQGILLVFFLLYLCNKYVTKNLRKKAYVYMSRLYLIIYGVIAMLEFISFAVDADAEMHSIISSACTVVCLLIVTGIDFLMYKKISDRDDGGEDLFKVVFVDPTPKKEEDIFDGFGDKHGSSDDDVFGDFDVPSDTDKKNDENDHNDFGL